MKRVYIAVILLSVLTVATWGVGKTEFQPLYWDDLVVQISGVDLAGAPQPASLNVTDCYGALTFSGTLENNIVACAQLPHSYRNATSISPHIHFSSVSAGVATCVFELIYKRAAANGTVPTSYTVATLTVQTAAATTTIVLADFPDVTMAGIGDSGLMSFMFRRLPGDPADNAGNINLWGLDFHFQKDRLGSILEDGDPQ